jgi:hypothetical protein
MNMKWWAQEQNCLPSVHALKSAHLSHQQLCFMFGNTYFKHMLRQKPFIIFPMLFTLTKPITGHNLSPNYVTAHYSTEPTTKLASFIKHYTIYEPVFYSVSRVF